MDGEILKDQKVILSDYAKFFNDKIANKIYEINFESSNIYLKITPANFAHLIGLHKFKANKNQKVNSFLKDESQLKEFKGYYNLYKGNITIDHLKEVVDKNGNQIFDRYKERISSIKLIYSMIRESELMEFTPDKVQGIKSSIPNGYMFVKPKNDDGNNLILFITKNKEYFYPVTLFVISDNTIYNNYIKNQNEIEIKSIVIKDFNKVNILETINKDSSLVEIAATIDRSSKIISKRTLNILKLKKINLISIEKTNTFNRFKITFDKSNEENINKIIKKSKVIEK